MLRTQKPVPEHSALLVQVKLRSAKQSGCFLPDSARGLQALTYIQDLPANNQ